MKTANIVTNFRAFTLSLVFDVVRFFIISLTDKTLFIIRESVHFITLKNLIFYKTLTVVDLLRKSSFCRKCIQIYSFTTFGVFIFHRRHVPLNFVCFDSKAIGTVHACFVIFLDTNLNIFGKNVTLRM